jgi:hypothetical protein
MRKLLFSLLGGNHELEKRARSHGMMNTAPTTDPAPMPVNKQTQIRRTEGQHSQAHNRHQCPGQLK